MYELSIFLFYAFVDRDNLQDKDGISSINEQYWKIFEYQLMGRVSIQTVFQISERLGNFSRSLRNVMSWFKINWQHVRFAPLYAEIFDIPMNRSAVAQAPGYPPTSDVTQITQYTYQLNIPAPTSEYNNCNGTPQPLKKEEQSPGGYAPVQYQTDYSNNPYMNTVSGMYYANQTVADQYSVDQNVQMSQQIIYLNNMHQERWHTSAFEPYSTDMAANGKVAYSQQALELNTAGDISDVSRNEPVGIDAIGTYQEDPSRGGGSLGSTGSPGALQNDMVVQGVPPTAVEGQQQGQGQHTDGDNSIVSRDDPFAEHLNAQLPLLPGFALPALGVDQDPANNQVLWIDQQSVNDENGGRTEIDPRDIKVGMPILTPAATSTTEINIPEGKSAEGESKISEVKCEAEESNKKAVDAASDSS